MSEAAKIIRGWWDLYKDKEITPAMLASAKVLFDVIKPSLTKMDNLTYLWTILGKITIDRENDVHPFLKKALDGSWDPLFYAYLKGGNHVEDTILARWYLSDNTPPAPIMGVDFVKGVVERAYSAESYPVFMESLLNLSLEDHPIMVGATTHLKEVLIKHASAGLPLAYDVSYPEVTLLRNYLFHADSVFMEVLFSDDPEKVACFLLENPKGSLGHAIALQKLSIMGVSAPTL